MPQDSLLDLSSCERKILSSVSLPGTLAEISRRLSLSRSTVEYNLKKLYKNKLIVFSMHGKRRIYSLRVEKGFTLNTRPPSPILKFGPITLYTGVKAIETLWQEVAKESNESRLTGIQPRKSFREAIKRSSKETVSGVSQTITDKRFIIDAIVHEDLAKSIFMEYEGKEAKSIAKVFTGRLEDMVKVDSNFLDEKAEMFIIGNFSFFIDWFNEIAIKIENRNINSLLNSIYRATKAYGKRYEQGRYIEKLIGSK